MKLWRLTGLTWMDHWRTFDFGEHSLKAVDQNSSYTPSSTGNITPDLVPESVFSHRFGPIDISYRFSYSLSMKRFTGTYRFGLLFAIFLVALVGATNASEPLTSNHVEFLTYGKPVTNYYFALNLSHRLNNKNTVGLGSMQASYWFPDINSREYELGYGYEPPSVAEQLLYSVGMVLLQTGAQRLEAHSRGY